MRRLASTKFAFVAALLLPGAALAQAPAPAPVCTGRDLIGDFRDAGSPEWARISEAAERTINARSVFWRIEGSAGPPSHLLGTVHLTDDRINALPPAVETALGAARRLALEVADLSPQSLGAAIARVQGLLVYADGQSLQHQLSPEELATARQAIEKAGMPAAAIASLKPWVVGMTLSLSDCERRRAATGLEPLDLRLAGRARQRGIPVVGLETLEDQLRAMAAVPEGDQLTILKAGLKLYGLSDDMIETMVARYLGRELGLIWPLQEEIWRRAGYPPAAFASFQHELVTVRNVRMRDAALPLLAEGGVFIAVGALHLPGMNGLVELIRGAGYKVTPGE